ncbi:hypothetical protein Tcan_09535, partial [Toxocara canis]
KPSHSALLKISQSFQFVPVHASADIAVGSTVVKLEIDFVDGGCEDVDAPLYCPVLFRKCVVGVVVRCNPTALVHLSVPNRLTYFTTFFSLDHHVCFQMYAHCSVPVRT